MVADRAFRWHSPEKLVAIGFDRSRVVMMNEAHDGHRRCIRTRQIGQRIVPAAHAAGVRHLAMEALSRPATAEEINRSRGIPEATHGYLNQPEMRAFVGTALAHGWTLISYEAQFTAETLSQPETTERINWREREQAMNLSAALRDLPLNQKVLVWCGNSHLSKKVAGTRPSEQWTPMGYLFKVLSGVEPFVIDQSIGVHFSSSPSVPDRVMARYRAHLVECGGTAGFLSSAPPPGFPPGWSHDRYDAALLSTENALE